MKKIFWAIAAVMVISFASCGNQTESAAGADDTLDTVLTDTVDTVNAECDSVAAE